MPPAILLELEQVTLGTRAHELQHAADSNKEINIRRGDNKNGITDNEDRAVDAGSDYRIGVG